MINYTDFKNTLYGMSSARDIISENDKFYINRKHSKKVVLFLKNGNNNINIEDLHKDNLLDYKRICFSYIPDEKYQTFIKECRNKGIEFCNKYNSISIISLFNEEFFNLSGKKFREFRETKNQLDKKKKVIFSTECNDVENKVSSLIDKWNEGPGIKYRRTNHSGYDKTFFIKHYIENEDKYYSLFFCDVYDNLIGYSIIGKNYILNNHKKCYPYLIRKFINPDYGNIRNLGLYIDFCSFRRIWEEQEEEFYIHWGASSKKLLNYKRKFPIQSENKVRFFTIKTENNFK